MDDAFFAVAVELDRLSELFEPPFLAANAGLPSAINPIATQVMVQIRCMFRMIPSRGLC